MSEISASDNQTLPSIYLPLIDETNEEYKMNDVQLGVHTATSHGATIARKHMYDWLILALLVVMDVILYIIHPFYRFVGKDMMTDLKYPLKSQTVPLWIVPMYAILIPIVIFIVVYFRRRDIYDLHHAILGLLFSVLVTAVITDSIKNAVGRPRPDFFWRCFPDGNDAYDQLGNVVCHGDRSVVKEGHKSFPSGHTSWSFSGLGFLSLYLSGKLKAFDCKGHIAKLCVIFLPLLIACLVGISRVDDYWHHWQDVFAGGVLGNSGQVFRFRHLSAPHVVSLTVISTFFSGLIVSTFCYLQFFPPPYHPQGWGPYAYFRVLEEAQKIAEAPAALNLCNAAESDNHNVAENEQQEEKGFMGLQLEGDPSSRTTRDEECGRN